MPAVPRQSRPAVVEFGEGAGFSSPSLASGYWSSALSMLITIFWYVVLALYSRQSAFMLLSHFLQPQLREGGPQTPICAQTTQRCWGQLTQSLQLQKGSHSRQGRPAVSLCPLQGLARCLVYRRCLAVTRQKSAFYSPGSRTAGSGLGVHLDSKRVWLRSLWHI